MLKLSIFNSLALPWYDILTGGFGETISVVHSKLDDTSALSSN